MAINNNPVFPTALSGATQTFVNADGTTAKVIATAALNGSRIDAVSIVSTDTVAQVFNIIVNDGVNDRQVGTVNVPASSGTVAGTATVSLLTTINIAWLPSSGSVFLKTGWTLKLSAQVAITTAKTVSTVVFQGDY